MESDQNISQKPPLSTGCLLLHVFTPPAPLRVISLFSLNLRRNINCSKTALDCLRPPLRSVLLLLTSFRNWETCRLFYGWPGTFVSPAPTYHAPPLVPNAPHPSCPFYQWKTKTDTCMHLFSVCPNYRTHGTHELARFNKSWKCLFVGSFFFSFVFLSQKSDKQLRKEKNKLNVTDMFQKPFWNQVL